MYAIRIDFTCYHGVPEGSSSSQEAKTGNKLKILGTDSQIPNEMLLIMIIFYNLRQTPLPISEFPLKIIWTFFPI